MTSVARARRASFLTPLISRLYAMLSITVRCGSSPKCWNTMEKRVRRSSRSRDGDAVRMSSPLTSTLPAVGSISRVRHRTSVDLPEPDRPMTTNTSPGATSKDTSRTAATQPVCVSRSLRLRSARAVPTTLSALGPKTFHRPRTEMAAEASEATGSGSLMRKSPASAPRRTIRSGLG